MNAFTFHQDQLPEVGIKGSGEAPGNPMRGDAKNLSEVLVNGWWLDPDQIQFLVGIAKALRNGTLELERVDHISGLSVGVDRMMEISMRTFNAIFLKASPFREFRSDGLWPLCPSCEEDELAILPSQAGLSRFSFLGVVDLLISVVSCLKCGWKIVPLEPVQLECERLKDFI